jgi:hypothetical protein
MKIFCIGLAKTGTYSLSQALTTLGFNTIHDSSLCAHITARVLAGDKPDDLISRADAFCDWPHPILAFPILGEMYPDSCFILTDREPEAWIRSRLIHVLHSRVTGESRWIEADTRGWRSEREVLLSNTQAWAEEQPERMLYFNVKEGWEPLCTFLDKDIPVTPFPHENGAVRRLREIMDAYEPYEDTSAFVRLTHQGSECSECHSTGLHKMSCSQGDGKGLRFNV